MSEDNKKYKLAQKIARGGMAEIYIALDQEKSGDERLCCVKRILPHYAGDEEFIQMFRDEAKICQRFDHPNLIAVHDFTEIEGAWAIVMDLVAGSDLRAIFSACEKQKTRLSVPMICYIIAEAAKGLQYAHTKVDDITGKDLGIVHRDISPQNILLSFEGKIKVTDFGIAEADSKLNETKPGIVKGKYSYMSPEQIMAKPVDNRTDVFALGIVLWEALAMKRLFQGVNEVETIQLVKNCKITKDIKQLNPEVDDLLLNIVEKALKKDIKERYQNCSELERDLRRYIATIDQSFSHLHLSDFLKEVLKGKFDEFETNIQKALNSEISDSTDVPSPPQPEELDESEPKKLEINGEGLPPIPDGLMVTDSKNSDETKKNEDSLEISTGIMHSPSQVLGKEQPGSEAFSGSLNLSNKSKSKLADFKHKETGSKQGATPAWATQSSNVGISDSSLPSKPLILQLIAVACLMVLSGGGYYFYLQSKPTSQTLEIDYTPSRALVTINGTVQSNDYIAGPLTIENLPLGDHDITLRREGFEDLQYVATLKGKKPVKKINLALKRAHPVAPVELKLAKDSDESSLVYEFARNLDSGTISKKSSKRVRDLLYGKYYKVIFKSSDSAFGCKFQPRSRSWNRPYILVVFPESRKCRVISPKSKK
jgi:serine/threonine-protein kinase